ncbi:MAG: AfsR family transcriptional regulator, partial [Nonomuraea sp.]|nr:AfsR family transcriptional regulator [Nonomuraea sp.]
MFGVNVLGPMAVTRDGTEVELPPLPRLLLALLALTPGEPVSKDAIIDVLWGERPPATAATLVRTYLSRLRGALGAPAARVAGRGGYRLVLGDGRLDLAEFRALVAEGRLAQALRLWRGAPLSDVELPRTLPALTALRAEWVAAVLAYADADAPPVDVLPHLRAVVEADPLNEPGYARLIRALGADGRKAAAVEAYTAVRHRLAAELGIDPSPELSAASQELLGQATAVRPAQVPADTPDFSGREELAALLAERVSAGGGVVITGIGGVGKTTLAVHVAQAVRGRFPDGQVYADLRGTRDRPRPPEEVLGHFLVALGVPADDVPEGQDVREALWRSTLATRRVLVVLDNAHDEKQVRALLPGTGDSAAIVTGRARLAGLSGVHRVQLGVFEPAEAVELLAKITGRRDPAAPAVAEASGYLPLAIRIIGTRLATRPGWTAAEIAARLADRRRALRELRAGDLNVAVTFELSYAQADARTARAFRLAALPEGPDLSVEAAAALLDLPEDEAEDLLESLVELSMLESPSPGRYRFHDLVLTYARGLGGEDGALTRLLTYYTATARNALSAVEPAGPWPRCLLTLASEGRGFASAKQASAWLEAHAQHLMEAVTQAAGSGDGQVEI